MEKKVSSALVGVAGEYFVAAELSRLGYIASITLRNTKGIDIVASNEDGNKTINIQVKTKRLGVPDWILTKKNESIKGSNMFYVFVSLKTNDEKPDYHIVSSIDVAKYITKRHAKWIDEPGRGGKKHKETNIRIWDDSNGEYLDRWDLLGLDT